MQFIRVHNCLHRSHRSSVSFHQNMISLYIPIRLAITRYEQLLQFTINNYIHMLLFANVIIIIQIWK